jgi:hypothetical protein
MYEVVSRVGVTEDSPFWEKRFCRARWTWVSDQSKRTKLPALVVFSLSQSGKDEPATRTTDENCPTQAKTGLEWATRLKPVSLGPFGTAESRALIRIALPTAPLPEKVSVMLQR